MSRLLLVLHQLGTGGVERVTLHLANGLARRGHEVTLALANTDGALQGQLDAGVMVRALPDGTTVRRGAGLLRLAPALASLAEELQPNWLVSAGNHVAPLVVLAQRRVRGRKPKLALKFTNPIVRPAENALFNAARRFFFRRASSQADRLLFLSEAALNGARALVPRTRHNRLKLVANPYVPDAWMKAAKELGPRPKSAVPNLLTVGRLTAQKDQAMMLDALALLEHRSWRLNILGDGPLRQALEAQADALGLRDRIAFAGFQPDPGPALREADLFLLSSSYEELPAVLFEAAAAGCTIVSTAASQAIVDLFGDVAQITPPRDAQAFARAIETGLDRDTTPKAPPLALLRRHTFETGVQSHAEALDLR